MKNISIMEDPKAFFESLSASEFQDLLDEFQFEYEDVSKERYTIKNIKKYIQNIRINKYKDESIHFHLNQLIDQKNDIKMNEFHISICGIDSEKIINNIKKPNEILMEDKYDFYDLELGAA